ncbi:MAG: hypothetical protein QOF75_2151 [Gaiellaceae bacterium]|nr:hypothetical protein [Gaiellaceae bacterium]
MRARLRAAATPGTALAAAGLALGVGLRVWILRSSQGALDADESVWGLMAIHVLHGHIPVFFWGQAYGGTQETLVTAALFWIFGTGTAALKTAPILFWAAATVLLWRVGRRTLGEPRARLAAALFWCWPLFFVWKSTRAHGFYGAALVFGLWAMLAALRLRERPSTADDVQLGLALGLGWWATPQIAILGLPAVIWLVVTRRQALRGAPVAFCAFLVGSLPWWIYNIRHSWASLNTGRDESSKLGHLHNLFSSTLPTGLGLRLPFSLEWVPNVEVGVVAYVLLLAGLAWLFVRRPAGLGLPLLAAGLFPVLYAASPYTWLNLEPRYLTEISPVLVLLVAYAARGAVRATAIFAAAAALSVGGTALMIEHDLAASHAGGVALPADFGPLIRTLHANHVDRAWATYWIGYRITFESRETIIAASPGSSLYHLRHGVVVPSPTLDPGGAGRYPPYQNAVLRSTRAAHVFAIGEPLENVARPLLRRARYRLVSTDGFDVWLPPR